MDNIENKINEFSMLDKIREKLEDTNDYKVIVVDKSIYENNKQDSIIEKAKSYGFQDVLNNEIGYEIKIIESCNELMQQQARMLDLYPCDLPIIISNETSSLFSYEKNLSKIKGVNDIIIELLSFKEVIEMEHKNLCIIILTQKEESYIRNNVIYLSIQDFWNLDIEKETNLDSYLSNQLYPYPKLQINLTSIISTYQDIMKPKLKYECIQEDEQTYLLKHSKHEFKILFLFHHDELLNDEIELSNYECIIEEKELKEIKPSILYSKNLDCIYRKLKTPGKYFRV